ncbi:MAG: hypothetical protein NTV23_13225 [Propionibacteriales bacterium]|nr:hypothetical protein [Propionibacteriales bacterium]
MARIDELLEAEAVAAEMAEADQDSAVRTDVRITRGHSRSRTLQVRLNDHELDQLTAYADQRGLPVSTVARLFLLQALSPADDLHAVFDRIERDLSNIRREALSTNAPDT